MFSLKGRIAMDIREESLKLHYDWKGKIEVTTRCDVSDTYGLSTAYTPGVAQPCLEIQKDISKSYDLTRRHNLVAVVTDGTAVLGLGDIGPEAGMPVMEGKCALFKAFADVDAFPICVKSKDVDEIVNTIYMISGSFGGINLEDISAPRCFEIERKLKEKCDIPVFHDDQHGTAVVVAAALINALKIVKKDLSNIKIVVNGAGAAVVGTGRSDFPNQINNVLVFPGLFRGVLDCRAREINEEMKVAASYAIAGLVSDEELNPDYVIPAAFDKRVSRAVADAVIKAAIALCSDAFL